ncbi:glycerophosphodiester phosphodiesterase family protein [Rubrivirga litoralis]|uniref:Glycerophosphodiester phosphodiesterase family protein n=1 Tax=Rubrivirga litoralis TaxID=3075598 RepID=A0ABU3BU88_9BACT|nr:glycerophosphodiester phosphodiesterase family protein [Rubrivirga sp. F394]MDT0632843.1 glycerophosphodiester phosphodiesterase family protein [Rubrivirga sp. F394]
MTLGLRPAPPHDVSLRPTPPRPLWRGGVAAFASLLAVALGACGSPRPLALEERPADRVVVPTSSVHYRDYDTADDLAAALRWRPGAPVLVSAHRGAPPHGLPENSLATFEHALNFAPALIETDVRRTADGVLVLMHDETLDRTTTGTGRVDETSFEAIRSLRLVTEDSLVTSFRVPTLAEALAWAEARTVLLLDVKSDVPYEELVAEVERLEAADQSAVIVYSLEDHLRLYALDPDLVVSSTAETVAAADALLASDVDLSRVVAWTGVGPPDADVVARLHAAGIRAQAGAYGAIDDEAAATATAEPYDALLVTGVDVIGTDEVAAAALAARRANANRPAPSPRP